MMVCTDALPNDREPNFGARAHRASLSTAWLRGNTFDRNTVDLAADVPCQNSSLGGRRIADQRNHLEDAVLHVDLHAEPAEFAAGCCPHVAIALFASM
jgi:hypothetical protein